MKTLFFYVLGFISPLVLIFTINTAEKYHHNNGRPIWDDITNKMHYNILIDKTDFNTGKK